MIPTLIDKQDTFEIIRDKIAVILATESANQVALATTASKPNPADWKLRVFLERSNPFEEFLNYKEGDDVSPLVNVWYDNSNFDESASNVAKRQKATGVYNIDCYGFGLAEDVSGGGHKPGDKEASIVVHRAVRLVRNILMAAEYTYLDLRGIVWQRWTQSINILQPEIENQAVQQIVAARIAFRVIFNELSPQVATETLEQVFVDVKRAENGEILAEANYDYTV